MYDRDVAASTGAVGALAAPWFSAGLPAPIVGLRDAIRIASFLEVRACVADVARSGLLATYASDADILGLVKARYQSRLLAAEGVA